MKTEQTNQRPAHSPLPSATCSAPTLNREQIAILDHTENRAARGLYCGGGKEMAALVALGMMESAGRAAWCPDEYFRITGKGRAALRQAQNAAGEPQPTCDSRQP